MSDEIRPSHFLRNLIEGELREQVYAGRHWGGSPGDAAHHAAGPIDPAPVRLRFPPEPNGFLHIGHAKSICLNFGLARDFGGVCHLRFDDTNPEKEEQAYVDGIIEMVRWLGWDWKFAGDDCLYWASDYFEFMVRAAEHLIERGLAYVDEQSADEIRANRGDFSTPGTPSPWRDRPAAESLERFRQMQRGEHPDGAMVLRARIDMASPNINLRDPALYRIRHATHHNTGDRWRVYPMYTFAHPIEDALENITHSICTLEFEDQRPFYDWLLARLTEGGLINVPPPKQHEFGRLNVRHVITSKRHLRSLVEQGLVDGWDDPRMPTLVGLRRRGVPPAAIRRFCDETGASKTNIWLDPSLLDAAIRTELEPTAPRAMAVLDPVELQLTNWAEVFGRDDHLEDCSAPFHPQRPELGQRRFTLGPRLWIEREDFAEAPPKGFHRLFPGNKARLKYGYVIECTGCDKDAEGQVTRVLARLVPGTKSGTPGADTVKVKGVITWVGQHEGVGADVALYEPLFRDAQPDPSSAPLAELLNPGSRRVVQAWLEPSLARAGADERVQFERHGYFASDRETHRPDAQRWHRITALKDSFTPPKA